MNTEGGLSGKGESGMGTTRGRASFEAFTHRKVVGINVPNFDPMVKYPPYDVSTVSIHDVPPPSFAERSFRVPYTPPETAV